MKITKRQLKQIIKESKNEAMEAPGQLNPEYLQEKATDDIEVILNEFYDDLVVEAGMLPEDAQEKMQELIDKIAMHSQQGFIGMPT